MIRPVELAWVAFLLGACSATSTAPPPVGASSPSVAAVSASEAALAAAGRVILACYSVPSCAAVAPKAQIKGYYDAAYSAVTSAQAVADAGGSPDLTAATAALATLNSAVSQLPKPAGS